MEDTPTITRDAQARPGPVDLDVVIVSYNTRDMLEECLASVLAETKGISLRVWVVDNASRDGSIEMVRAKFPGVILQANTDNVGFARANNQVLRRADARHVLLLNSDTKIFPGSRALEAMVAFMDAHPGIGALGPKILYEDGSIQYHCARSFPSLWTSFCQITTLARRFPGNRLTGRYMMSWWDHESPREVDCLLGACMMVPRAVLDQVGGLDEDFFLGGEDVDWCLRIRRAGWSVFYEPSIAILHYGGASKRQMEEHEGKELNIAYYKYFRKHHGPAYALAWRVMTGTLSLVWVAICALQMPFRPARREALKNLAALNRDIFVWCLTGRG